MGENGESLYLYRGNDMVRLPTFSLRIAYFPSATIDGMVGLPIPVLMRIL